MSETVDESLNGPLVAFHQQPFEQKRSIVICIIIIIYHQPLPSLRQGDRTSHQCQIKLSIDSIAHIKKLHTAKLPMFIFTHLQNTLANLKIWHDKNVNIKRYLYI